MSEGESPAPAPKPEANEIQVLSRALGELLKTLPEQHSTERIAEIIATFSVEVTREFRGPIPPPEMLKQYEAVIPGLAERIVARAEREQQFRHEVVREDQSFRREQMRRAADITMRGQNIGGVVALVALCGSLLAIYLGQSAWGVSGIIGTITGLVAVFVYAAKRGGVVQDDSSE